MLFKFYHASELLRGFVKITGQFLIPKTAVRAKDGWVFFNNSFNAEAAVLEAVF